MFYCFLLSIIKTFSFHSLSHYDRDQHRKDEQHYRYHITISKIEMRPGIEFKGFAYTIKLLPKSDAVKVCKTVEEWKEELGKACGQIYNFILSNVSSCANPKLL